MSCKEGSTGHENCVRSERNVECSSVTPVKCRYFSEHPRTFGSTCPVLTREDIVLLHLHPFTNNSFHFLIIVKSVKMYEMHEGTRGIVLKYNGD
jgi:hypothetical protein